MRAKRFLSVLTIGGLMAVASGGCATRTSGILVMAHGGDEAWNRDVERTVAPLRAKYPVEIAFGMADPNTMEEAVRKLEERGVRRVAVVRVFISGESFLDTTEYILGLRNEPPDGNDAPHMAHAMHISVAELGSQVDSDAPSAHKAHAARTRHEDDGHEHAAHGHSEHDRAAHHLMEHTGHGHHDGQAHPTSAEAGAHHHMAPPRPITPRATFVLSDQGVAESPFVDDILVDRVKALSKNPAKESILFLAHGPADEAENERWLANMRLRVQRVHKIGPFRHIQVETLREDWPQRRAEAERRIRGYVETALAEGGKVIVVPFRVAGFGPYAEVLEGLDYVADGRGFCPHPNMTRWIEQTARKCWSRNAKAGG